MICAVPFLPRDHKTFAKVLGVILLASNPKVFRWEFWKTVFWATPQTWVVSTQVWPKGPVSLNLRALLKMCFSTLHLWKSCLFLSSIWILGCMSQSASGLILRSKCLARSLKPQDRMAFQEAVVGRDNDCCWPRANHLGNTTSQTRCHTIFWLPKETGVTAYISLLRKLGQ